VYLTARPRIQAHLIEALFFQVVDPAWIAIVRGSSSTNLLILGVRALVSSTLLVLLFLLFIVLLLPMPCNLLLTLLNPLLMRHDCLNTPRVHPPPAPLKLFPAHAPGLVNHAHKSSPSCHRRLTLRLTVSVLCKDAFKRANFVRMAG
jgi:hypothetical protein